MKNSESDRQQPTTVLASASPRRTQLLDELGILHRVLPANIDETPAAGEQPFGYVRRMAAAKARTGQRLAALAPDGPQVGSDGGSEEVAVEDVSLAVLAADTIVVADGLILGKPQNASECVAMLARLSGRTHLVATAVCLRHQVRQAAVCSVTQVTFRSVSVQEARSYWASGEPRDKAGGYGIQGAASAFVSRVDGSYTGVIGLPLVETRALFRSLGLYPDLKVQSVS